MNIIGNSKTTFKNAGSGIVISDKTLCLGIDLPVKHLASWRQMEILLHKTNIYKCLEGQEGVVKITQGNVIFFGEIDYFNLMKTRTSKYSWDVKPIYDNYRALPNVSSTLFSNMINNERNTLKIQKHLWMTKEENFMGIEEI